MIEDAELRDIYKTASAERLQKIEAGLMHLEKHPQDRAKLDEIMREAHTFKGDSRMLGVQDVETIIHQLEDVLGAVNRGESHLTAQMCDRLYQGIDAVRQLVHQAVTGEPTEVNIFHTLARLMGAEVDTADEDNALGEGIKAGFDDDFLFDNQANLALQPISPVNGIKATFDSNTALLQEASERSNGLNGFKTEPIDSAGQAANPQSNNYQIDTIRVEPKKLDDLMRQAGELSVTNLRIGHWVAEIEEILTLWEEWSRDTAINRSALASLEEGSYNGHTKQIQNFFNRAEQRTEQLGILVNRLKNTASKDTARLKKLTGELAAGIESLRLLPLSTIFNLFPRTVRDLAKQQSKAVNLIVEGEILKQISGFLKKSKIRSCTSSVTQLTTGLKRPKSVKPWVNLPRQPFTLEGIKAAVILALR